MIKIKSIRNNKVNNTALVTQEAEAAIQFLKTNTKTDASKIDSN